MPETTTSYLPFYDKITDLMGGKAHVVHYVTKYSLLKKFHVLLRKSSADCAQLCFSLSLIL